MNDDIQSKRSIEDLPDAEKLPNPGDVIPDPPPMFTSREMFAFALGSVIAAVAALVLVLILR